MKLSFTADFRWNREGRFRPVHEEEELNDIFLAFLPKRIEIIKNNKKGGYGVYYTVTMETDKIFSLEELKEELAKRSVLIKDLCDIKRTFTPKELKEIQKMVCFKEVFNPSGATK